MANQTKTAAIVGVAESDQIGIVPEKSALMLHMEAARNAIADAGLTKDDVDGFLTAGYAGYDVAEYLGIHPTYTDSTSVGGSSFVIHVAHAVAAINAGYCEVALITHGQAGRSARSPFGQAHVQGVQRHCRTQPSAARAGSAATQWSMTLSSPKRPSCQQEAVATIAPASSSTSRTRSGR